MYDLVNAPCPTPTPTPNTYTPDLDSNFGLMQNCFRPGFLFTLFLGPPSCGAENGDSDKMGEKPPRLPSRTLGKETPPFIQVEARLKEMVQKMAHA